MPKAAKSPESHTPSGSQRSLPRKQPIARGNARRHYLAACLGRNKDLLPDMDALADLDLNTVKTTPREMGSGLGSKVEQAARVLEGIEG